MTFAWEIFGAIWMPLAWERFGAIWLPFAWELFELRFIGFDSVVLLLFLGISIKATTASKV